MMAIARISRHHRSEKIHRHIFENAPKRCLASSKQQATNPDFSAFRIRMFLNKPGNHPGYKQNNPDLPFRIHTNSDITLAIARISLLFHNRIFRTDPDLASGQIWISRWCYPDFVRISHPDFPDHFTSGFSGQIRISHPEKFGYP